MILLISFLFILFFVSTWTGYRRYLRLEHLNKRILLNSLLAALIILTALSILQWQDIVTELFVARFTMGLYSIAAGFFIGSGLKLMLRKRKAGEINYSYRSFWIDLAPNIISIILVAYGLYRTGLLHNEFITGIGVTSGFSLIGFGFFGWTIRLVPEFRREGILILDRYIEWKKVVSYEWKSEGAVTINYWDEHNQLYEFTTSIPPDDQLLIERLLARKINEFKEEREKMIEKQEAS